MTFEGIRPVLHLAFESTPDELNRFGDLDRLVDRILASGVAGPVVLGLGLGLASEAWALTEDERETVLGHVAAAVAQQEEATLDRLFAEPEAAEIPGFARVAA